jgi:hypothetical protein
MKNRLFSGDCFSSPFYLCLIFPGILLIMKKPKDAGESMPSGSHSEMIYRPLGGTGKTVSAIGLGGWHLGPIDEGLSLRIIRSAPDRGITFLDN